MMKQLFTVGLSLATLPARLALKGTREMWLLPANWEHFARELQLASAEVRRELTQLVESVDAEMNARAGHLTPEQKQQATGLALRAAEQHLSMAARDVLRALWLAGSAEQQLRAERDSRLQR
ncbi:MAG: hypothetical protein AAGI11_13785 [Pseudomonadota bacterium]